MNLAEGAGFEPSDPRIENVVAQLGEFSRTSVPTPQQLVVEASSNFFTLPRDNKPIALPPAGLAPDTERSERNLGLGSALFSLNKSGYPKNPLHAHRRQGTSFLTPRTLPVSSRRAPVVTNRALYTVAGSSACQSVLQAKGRIVFGCTRD
jgi:hypothetical protein